MKGIRFTKAQGLGNDFLIVEVEDLSMTSALGELAVRLSDRHYGTGADGVVYFRPSPDGPAHFDSRIFNADGGEAEVSGNGTRCLAASLYYSRGWTQPEIDIATAAGIKHGRLVSRDGPRFEFEFDMGSPKLGSSDIPMLLDQPLAEVVAHPLKLGGDLLDVTCVSMGNPHCTLFVSDPGSIRIDELGPLIEDHPVFPNRTNVEFARVISRDEIEVIFWERGVGRTLSSGTGSCGAAVAAGLNGLTGRTVRVRTGGGILTVNWRDDDRVMLTGPAEVVYEGTWLQE